MPSSWRRRPLPVDRHTIVTDRTEESLVEELSHLLHRIARSESLVERAEAYYAEKQPSMSPKLEPYFLDWLERKRDQIEYEWSRVDKLGREIHAGRMYGFGEL
jgi:hypothetical protein